MRAFKRLVEMDCSKCSKSVICSQRPNLTIQRALQRMPFVTEYGAVGLHGGDFKGRAVATTTLNARMKPLAFRQQTEREHRRYDVCRG